jgi:hypothetical protein
MNKTPDNRHDSFLLGHVSDQAELAVDYLDGVLAPAERSLVEAHLEACPVCRNQMRLQKETAALTRGVRMEAPPSELEARVFAGLAAESKAEFFARRVVESPVRSTSGFWSRLGRFGRPRYLAAAAAVTAALVVASVGLTGDRNDLVQTVSETGTPKTATVVTTTPGVSESYVQPVTTDQGGSSEPSVAPNSTDTTTPPQTSSSTTGTTSVATTPTTVGRAGKIALLVDSPVVDTPADSDMVWVAVRASEERGGDVAGFFETVTGLHALPDYYWLGGPTYAAVATAPHLMALIDALVAQGLHVERIPQPVDPYGNALPGLKAGILTYKQMLPTPEQVAQAVPGGTDTQLLSLVVFVVPQSSIQTAE